MTPEERQAKTVSSTEWRELYQERTEQLFQLDPAVPVMLGGKEYKLEFDNRAAKGVWKDAGFNILSTVLAPEHLQDPIILGALLRHGLLRHHPEITEDEADSLCVHRLYPYIISRLQKALNMFVPDMSDVTCEELERQRAAKAQDPNLLRR